MDAITDRPARAPIRAAGGLVARDATSGEQASPAPRPERTGAADQHILLVHRPRFDDWSLPKGKLKRGEHPLAAAVREVHEETAVWGVPGIRLPSVSYQVWSGQSLVDKTVDWWAMGAPDADGSPCGGSGRPEAFTPSDEVDDVSWVPIATALEILTYERDRVVVSAFADLPPLARPVVLLRNASVDESPAGQARATALADLLGLLRPARLVGAQPLRYQQPLADLARALAIEVDVDARFDGGADPDTAAAALQSLAGDTAIVVCGQDPLIQATVARLAGPGHQQVTPMGDALVLSFSGDRLIAADPLTPGIGGPGLSRAWPGPIGPGQLLDD